MSKTSSELSKGLEDLSKEMSDNEFLSFTKWEQVMMGIASINTAASISILEKLEQKPKVTREWVTNWALELANTKKKVGYKKLIEQMISEFGFGIED